MFKKVFTWIKERIQMIHKKIYDMKVEEFRRKREVTYVNEEIHKDPELERYWANINHKETYDFFMINYILFVVAACIGIIIYAIKK